MLTDYSQFLSTDELTKLHALANDPEFSDKDKKEAIRRVYQALFKRDFRAFVYLLKYRDLGAFHSGCLSEISKIRNLESQPVRRLWLWARGFFKTSLITESHTLWLIVNNPDIRILIVSFSLEVAKKPLGAIRNQFLTNEDFRYFFREFCPLPNKEGKIEWGTSEAFTIPNRSKSLKEPTVMCAGVGTNITGLHFDYMKIDDLVNKDSVTNDTQIQSSKDYYSLLRPIFDNPTIPREDVIGTIYHFNDLHSELKKNVDFFKSEIPAYTEVNNERQFVFPERLSESGWESLIGDPSLSPNDIQRQWLLRPVNPKDAIFKEEWIKTYDTLPQGLAEYICVDPASTQKKKSDYTVIERWGVDSERRHYLLEGSRDRFTAFQRIDKLFQIVKNCKNLKWCKYEVLGGRHGDLEVINERMRKEKTFFILRETKSTTISKKDRITQRLQGRYSSGSIFFPYSLPYRDIEGKLHDFVQEFKLELLQFPNTEHDDILDCHSQMFEEEVQKGEVGKEVKKDFTADDEEKYYERIKKQTDLLQRRFPFDTIDLKDVKRKVLLRC